ncbi:class I adenylate-forming enzyme family protein [Cysteiniphilum sp. QT6929]|uniref:class I adenylate-forming enzyme family protein n=1 Tax=Cysteiniphilum sp. QT6929 TaxID=2975055 RepID=UPI0024B38D2E|nr:class I adenylate-forming enzyme family protein [Cysteiniphilum sp. QT6929]WHN66269.1 acyl--CoA ligase [Cysteiniphilum sp. QT6929]
MLTPLDIQTVDHFLAYLKRLDTTPMFIYQDQVFSYADMYDYTFSLTHWLKGNNTNKVMFAIHNSPLSVGLFFASWYQRVNCIPVNPRFIANELLKIVKRAKPDLLMIEPKQYSDALNHYCQIQQIILVIIDNALDYLQSLKKASSTETTDFPQAQSEGITYHISSGTGGHYNFHGHYTQQILAYAYARQFDYGLNKGDISLVHLSFNHAYAFSYQLLPNIALGNCMVLAPSFDATTSLKLIDQYQITALALLPTMYYQLALEAQKTPINHKLRHLSVAGDQPSESLIHLIKETFNTPLLNGLGMTEVYGYAQNLTASSVYNKIKIFDDIKIKIEAIEHDHLKHVNDDNKHIGELYIKAPMQPISHQGQWLATGDYGYIDDTHHLYFLGRIKDIIVKGGSKIAPLELEHYLYQMPEIGQVAIIGKKDDIWGELVCSCIATKDNQSLTLEAINTFLTPFLATYKHIDQLYLYPQLPLNITGKIDRFRLKTEINNA